MDKKTLQQILDLAVYAPSGDNCQPWRFEMKDGILRVFDIPERDTSLYNFRRIAAYVNHGALLENISIVAPSFGFETSIDFLPEKNNESLMANVKFERIPVQHHPLKEVILSRHTNRKSFENRSIANEVLEEMQKVIGSDSAAQLLFVTDDVSKKEIGRAVSKNEIILFKNQKLHSYFFNHINWLPKLNDEIGMPISTLEIPKPALPMFKLLRFWNLAKFLSFFRIPSVIAIQNTPIYSSGGAQGAIVYKDFSPLNIIRTGMLFERLWLLSTKLGLKFQPLMGIVFLEQQIRAHDLSDLHGNEPEIIEQAYSEMCKKFRVSSGVITAAFRIGYGPNPSGKTKRLPAEIKYL